MVTVKRITTQHVKDWEIRRVTPPVPFTPAPDRLAPFLTNLDPSKVYITHIDRFPAAFKKQIFAVPVILNLFIFAALAWRAYAMIPWYGNVLNLFVGNFSTLAVDRDAHSKLGLAWIVLRRSLNFMLDFVLVRFVAAWPYSFFLESPCSPVGWRWRVGFRDNEIVVRESRRWGGKELLGGVKTGQDSPFFKTRLLPAIDRRWIREKSGYMMMNSDWDLDFYAMVMANRFVSLKELTLNDFEKTVLAHKEGMGWVAWRVHELDKSGDEEEQRKKIVMLKDKLTAMGKESLFFRWIEIVQYESGKPGEFDRKRQEQTMEIIKSEFEKQGVDFEKLAQEVGGIEGTPGMQT
ncbi:hypothetical protein K461DRAFT_232597 [Myriangium duriaei CBS 260.36]|uniref:Uncharacterized protein n=1 Tax=Myriangium duriaei CBS 260.36 TaxID=1168546 RepID=A0A9P4IUQ6_9PEZI|nr:hypothetical protein K461DRAFT_232597 [Myriangium duriaei CBS 260.36]